MKPICVKCGLFYRIIRNGVVVEEGMPANHDARPGEGDWRPYKLYRADHWQCKGCSAELALATNQPFSEHYMSDYKELKARHPPLVFIKDC